MSATAIRKEQSFLAFASSEYDLYEFLVECFNIKRYSVLMSGLSVFLKNFC